METEPRQLPGWLAGDYPRDALVSDIAAVAALPQPVRDDFWQVLQPNMAERLDDRVGALVAKFCRSRQIEPKDLLEPVRAARWVLLRAAKFNIEPDVVRQQLASVSEPAAEVLARCCQEAHEALRMRIVRNSLAQHGKLVRAVGWRVDTVRRTHDGGGINMPVALLTFRYTEGERDDRITLQLMPEALADLQLAIKEITG